MRLDEQLRGKLNQFGQLGVDFVQLIDVATFGRIKGYI